MGILLPIRVLEDLFCNQLVWRDVLIRPRGFWEDQLQRATFSFVSSAVFRVSPQGRWSQEIFRRQVEINPYRRAIIFKFVSGVLPSFIESNCGDRET